MMNLIVSAPSGSGKTTILKEMFKIFPDVFGFSVSATTRKPRAGEKDKVDYYFISEEEFKYKIQRGEFLEYEQVYQGLYYGTLKSEIERIESDGHKVIFDVDVKGGVNIKEKLKNNCCSVFIMPPDIKTLEERLIRRNTETPETIKKRIDRATMELQYSDQFDYIVINDDLNTAINELKNIIQSRVLSE